MNLSEFKEELKRIVSKCTVKTIISSSRLSRMGFSVKRGGKHFILIYHGLEKDHKFIMSVTSSDKKSINNLVSSIMNSIKDDYRMVTL